MANKVDIEFLTNSVVRHLATQFPGFYNGSPKHDNWVDFGFPANITFAQYFQMYKRNALGKAGIQRIVQKTWRDYPVLVNDPEVHEQNTEEKAVADAFSRLMFWERLMDLDEKGRVGCYGALIFRFADGQAFKEPVNSIGSGLNGLIEIIPVFSEQLVVSTVESDEKKENFGQPTMYGFNEAAVITDINKSNVKGNRSFEVHPDRVHIWSKDSTVFGLPALEAGFNDLLTIEKIIGSGGEGFWKNAKSAPILNMDKDASPESLAAAMGVPVSELTDKLNEVIKDWQRGFDQLLFTQGIDTKTLNVRLPQPKEFVDAATQSFAASLSIPMKILLGSQTGERASTEDGKEWCETVMSNRNNFVIPNINRIITRLQGFSVVPKGEWIVSWTDLTEATAAEKMEHAEKMASVNQKLLGSGERAFTIDEIRDAVGLQPSDDLGLDLPDDLDDED